MKFLRSLAIPIALLLVGLAIVAYPLISDAWNSLHASMAVQSYDEACHDERNGRLQQLLNDAQTYNQRLLEADCGSTLPASLAGQYSSQLSLDASGVMGYVDIPAINVKLPIYHGTDEGALAAGTGHLEWSSLPVGGQGTHCVIAGHSGLPSATLFTHLGRVSIGDTFNITCLGQTLTYQVDEVSVVGPQDTSLLGIKEGQDLCTLLTCTPYGVNTSRLLVCGHRVETVATPQHVTTPGPAALDAQTQALVLSMLAAVALLGSLMLRRRRRLRA